MLKAFEKSIEKRSNKVGTAIKLSQPRDQSQRLSLTIVFIGSETHGLNK